MRKTSEILWQDAQHQVLFEILDQIQRPDVDAQVLFRLKDYTETHFSLEEHYMLRLGYPGLDAHVQAHNRFREEIDNLVADAGSFDPVFAQLIATFLREWLTRHIFGIDKELEAYILAADAK